MNGFIKFLLILVILSTLGNLVGQVILWAPPVSDNETAGGSDSGSENKPGNDNENKPEDEVQKPIADVQISATVTPDENGQVPAGGVSINGVTASATVPEGVQLEDGTTELTLTVNGLEESAADLDLSENEVSTSLDVHMAGVSTDNAIPMEIKLLAAAVKGLNSTSIKLYHVENGETVEMTYVPTSEEFTAHNQFKYDPATGDVTLYIAGFSEIAMISNTVNAWEGDFDYTWYDASKTELTIANADQLAAFGAIVGGMKKVTGIGENGYTYSEEIIQDSFEGKTVKLVADVNLGDKESENNTKIIFHPIGYWNNEGTYERKPLEERTTAVSSGFYTFEGVFDGNGHTIANFYQNTWEIKGDHNWYSAITEQYFRDGMGLFGKIYGGTVKNLTIENFSSDGEIATTGVIAAYADSKDGKPATFENISITNCNPRVYNIGNGGIVGCAGWYSRNESLGNTDYTNAVIFRNITVDQTNKISALWGTYDVSCGGILGQYYPDSNCGIKLENCHVAAQLDVHNDVCANYQYYWYRYSGMFIGTVRANTKDANGYTVADTTGITATDCTYTLGDWNQYWYCELVKNSLASYTHDHQFSRLTKIEDLSEIWDGTKWLKEGNFVIPADDNSSATCYHIFKNSEGELYQHFHDVADESNPNIYETFDLNGDGELNDLKEDRQCYFMPFNQVMNGLGYGVKAHYTFKGVEEVENGPVKAETKFESLGTVTTYRPGTTITLGQLVQAIVDESKISKATLYVAVSPAINNDNTKVSATYSLDNGNWENSTITFGENCSGAVKIVITDYFYCTPTVIVINEEGKSAKFEANNISEQNAYTQITLGDLFTAMSGKTIGNVTATVTDPNGNATTVTGTSSDWTTKTIDLTKDGTWMVSIIDDDKYCAATTVNFTVNKVNKFEVAFDHDDAKEGNQNYVDTYLYRVGNANTVKLDSLFEEIASALSVSSVNVTITNVAGNVTYTLSENTTWTKREIQFSGTGVIKITISADSTNDCTLNLEVVDAVNATTATSATSNNVVLLSDISGGFTVSGDYTVFGNGFTLNYTGNGQYLNNGLKQGVVTVSENGTLDNLRIKASIYPSAFMYYGYTAYADYVQQSTNPTEVEGEKTRYYYQLSAVVAKGNATISNCYIYGARTNIFVDTGDVTIKDTILECGTVANVQIQSTSEYTITLENVTTIQYQVNPTIGDTSLVMLGAGILVGPDNETNPKIVLNGNFKQYNWVTSDDANAVSNTMAKAIINGALDATDYNHTVNGKNASNLGIIYMNTTGISVENNTGLPYVHSDITITPEGFGGNSVEGQVYSLQNATSEQIYSDYENADRSTVNGDYIPTFNFDLGDQEISYDGSEDTRYLYGDSNGVTALYKDGDNALTLDLTKLATIHKYTGMNYTVTAVCKNSSGNALAQSNGVVTLNAQGSYTIVFTVEDNIFYDQNGNTIDKSVTRTYSVPLTLTVKEADVKNAEVDITQTTLDGVYTTVNLTDYKLRIDFLKCISITDYDNAGTGTTVVLTSNISSATLTPSSVNVFTTAFTATITYTDGRVLTVNFSKISGSSAGTKTATINTSGDLYFITDGALNDKPTEASSQNTCTITSVSYKGNSGSTVTNDTDVTVTWALGSSSSGGDSCLAEGTLITLADGTKKPVEELRKGDMAMSFDHLTGKLTAENVIIVVRTYTDHYYKNTFVFDDGTELVTINEHGIFDLDLNKYVNIDHLNYEQFIGHNFVAIDTNGNITTKKLVDVVTVEGDGYKYDIVTDGTLNYVAEDTLSVTHVLVDVINSFDFGANLMYDAEKMQADIEKYGLYDYSEWEEYCDISVFEEYNIPVMKVGISKGLYTKEYIISLINTYVLDESVQITD